MDIEKLNTNEFFDLCLKENVNQFELFKFAKIQTNNFEELSANYLLKSLEIYFFSLKFIFTEGKEMTFEEYIYYRRMIKSEEQTKEFKQISILYSEKYFEIINTENEEERKILIELNERMITTLNHEDYESKQLTKIIKDNYFFLDIDKIFDVLERGKVIPSAIVNQEFKYGQIHDLHSIIKKELKRITESTTDTESLNGNKTKLNRRQKIALLESVGVMKFLESNVFAGNQTQMANFLSIIINFDQQNIRKDISNAPELLLNDTKITNVIEPILYELGLKSKE
jgi:hypothetical protein